MSNDTQPGFQASSYKAAHPVGWLKARVRDIMVAAEVLHDAQWAAPWRDGQPSQRVRPDA